MGKLIYLNRKWLGFWKFWGHLNPNKMNTPFLITVFILRFQAFWTFLGDLGPIGRMSRVFRRAMGGRGPGWHLFSGIYRISYLFLLILFIYFRLFFYYLDLISEFFVSGFIFIEVLIAISDFWKKCYGINCNFNGMLFFWNLIFKLTV